MRAVVCRAYGPPEDLVVDDVADPTPGPGQLLVRVHTAAVNFPDVLLIAGKYQIKIPVPFTPGSELAGEVVAAGDHAQFRPGDRVYGTTPTGAFAELALLDAHQVSAIPDGADFAPAAAFGVTYRTAYHALRSVAQVAEGDWVVILGAAGGVGQAALDLAVGMKARVLAAASTEDKLDICRQRGAAATVAYDRDDLKSAIRELTGGGARVVLYPVGGRYAEQALRGLADRKSDE
jgi:NADPH:quinone reductase